MIKDIINKIRSNDNFTVHHIDKVPCVDSKDKFPPEVYEFYGVCGGISCYTQTGGFPIEILKFDKVQETNIKFFGEQYSDDITSSWYVIADLQDGNYISMDFDSSRMGWCYVSSAFGHGIVGECPIIALSFSELLTNLLNYKGDYFYWEDDPNFISYGDAYKK